MNVSELLDILQHCRDIMDEPSNKLAFYQILSFSILVIIVALFIIQAIVLLTSSRKLTLDTKLQLSHPNINEIMEEKLKRIQNIELSSYEKLNFLNRNPYPHESILVKLAAKVYKETKMNRSSIDIKMPYNWEVLTVAYNDAWTNGYFGVAYWNPKLQQIVVAHRGTKIGCVGALITDVIGVMYHKYATQVQSAVTFADKIKSIVTKHNDKENVSLTLSFTGHSLGGWLAQITSFTSEYLVPEKESYFVKDSNNTGVHSHTVAFDSPGCHWFLHKMKYHYDVRYGGSNSLSISNLDITSFLSAPNMVNNCHLHVGTIYRISIDSLHYWRFFDYLLYTKRTHSIDGIVKTLAKENYEKKLVMDWPLFDEGLQEIMLMGPLKRLVGMENEYESYHQAASKDENYDPNLQDEGKNSHYNVQVAPDTTMNTSVFSKREIDLWIKFNEVRAQVTTDAITEAISNLSDKETANAIIELFKNARIEGKKVQCKSKEELLKLVKYIKNVDRFFHQFRVENIELVELVRYVKNYQSFFPGFANDMDVGYEHNTGSLFPHFSENIESNVYKSFTERPNELFSIGNAFNESKRVLLYGVGGVGKTQLAVQYAHKYRDDHKGNVIWINSLTKKTVANSLNNLFEKLSLKNDSVNEIIKHVEGQQVLFIFDNVEKYEVITGISAQVDATNQVLITAQSGNIFEGTDIGEPIKKIEIKPLNNESALKVLKKAANITHMLLDNDLKELTKQLGYLPFALQLAASNIKQISGVEKIKKYITALLKSPMAMNSPTKRNGSNNFPNMLIFIIKAAIEKLKLTEEGHLAERILLTMSYLNHTGIDERIFLNMALKIFKLQENAANVEFAIQKIKNATKYLIDSYIISSPVATKHKVFNQVRIQKLVQDIIRVYIIQEEDALNEIEILSYALEHVPLSNENAVHLRTLWKYAKEYKELIDKFIISHKNNIDHFQRVIENCNYKTIDKMLTSLKLSDLEMLLNSRHPKTGCTTMHKAASFHNENLLYHIFRSGGNLNPASNDGLRPIHSAAIASNINAIRFLAYYGVKVNIPDNRGWTALHYAIERGSIEAVNLLLSFGADVNAPNSDKETPVFIAADNSRLDIMKLLVGKGAFLNLKTVSGKSLLHCVAHTGSIDVAEYLLNVKDTSASKNSKKYSTLFSKEKNSVVEEQSGKPLDLNARDIYGMTPIHYAATKNNIEIIKRFVRNDASPNVKDNQDWTPLHHAAEKGFYEVTEYLLTIANVNAMNNCKKTPIFLAMEHPDVVELLIKKGADLAVTDIIGWVPLNYAKHEKVIDMIKGANVVANADY